MDAKKQSMEDKKYLAKILYTREQLDAKAVAQRVLVSEKTIGKWVDEGNWKALRSRLLIGKDAQLDLMYIQLENLNTIIQNSEAGHADTKQADILIKLTAAIRNLEIDLAIADQVEAGIRFLKYLQRNEPIDQVITVSELWNSFLQYSIKK